MRETERRWLLWAYVAALILIPTVLLALRLVTGETVGYGWGWQMYS